VGARGVLREHGLELKRFGIDLKTIDPGGMKADFFTRSFDSGHHEAYGGLVDQVKDVIRDPKRTASYSTPDQIAKVVYEAATDGRIRFATSPAPTPRRRMRRASRPGTKRSARGWTSSSSGSAPRRRWVETIQRHRTP
jgi:hypothetical protein